MMGGMRRHTRSGRVLSDDRFFAVSPSDAVAFSPAPRIVDGSDVG